MVSDHDSELLTRFYEALNDGDFEAAMDLCNQEVEVYQPPEVVAALPPRGHRDVTEYLREFFGSWEVYQPEPEEFVEAGGKVVALVHLRARGLGQPLRDRGGDRRRVRGRRRQDLQAAPLRAPRHGAGPQANRPAPVGRLRVAQGSSEEEVEQ